MLRRLPVLPTMLVLLAVGVMIGLGLWQIDRMHQKDALLARYAAAPALSVDVQFPRSETQAEPVFYRHSRIDCRAVTATTMKAGQNRRGESGQAHYATCALAGGGTADVVLGWSRDLVPREWRGGPVMGVVAPGPRLVADPPLAGLDANARPDPSELPNNHLSYAVQWFLFAAVAVVIYALAVRKRLADRGGDR